ncbi:NAD(P)-dependent oxidoreductase [Roseburia hominis]
MTILVTGSSGMIGSQLVQGLLNAGHTVVGIDRSRDQTCGGNYYHYSADLGDEERLKEIADSNKVDRFIHLAALAHTEDEPDLSWDCYYHVNVECAKNVFEVANDRPVLFISTVDVYGFYDGKKPVNGETKLNPVSNYGKSKALAEAECRKLPHHTIFRFSPVYTDTIKRDIQKRYYLKYPSLAYKIGKGTQFEILNINNAVNAMVDWCQEEPKNDIRIIKDNVMMDTVAYILAEKAEGRAKRVLWIPQWVVNASYAVLKGILGENEKTYLLNKAVYPLRSE